MADIVLATLNARFSHASFGLRYLLANLGDLQPRAALLEFEIKTPTGKAVEAIRVQRPRILALGVYVWNAEPSLALVKAVRQAVPEALIVLGGPEVSHETDQQEICRLADYVVTDEGDLAFPVLCRQLLDGTPPTNRIIRGGFVNVRNVALPYHLYTDDDIAHRVIYVEASRGCPFSCEFCLSSLDVPVRRFPLEKLFPAFQDLLDRGVRHFKFVDRTFNLSIKYSLELLSFFLERYEPGIFMHFEMIPDRLPPELREILSFFPRGSLQFEVGIQTFNEDVAARIKRRQDYTKTAENMRWLRKETGAHLHADLIVGLPGEDRASFARGFDRLLALDPQEIQVYILKRLRGTPIARHDAEFQMRYQPGPPYELLSNRDLSEDDVAALHRFARFWDLYVNSGNYLDTAPLIWQGAASPFHAFYRFCDWLTARWGRAHSISIDESAEALFLWLTDELGNPQEETAQKIWRDMCRAVPRNRPAFLRSYVDVEASRGQRAAHLKGLQRQARRKHAPPSQSSD
ncbi:MAG: B12-binding domain-containing radical SAM protein [Kiritimatiellae bacterium]|nr:B12-binding domain-containing radical SAM protein [Kiritimatiellia bacterium]